MGMASTNRHENDQMADIQAIKARLTLTATAVAVGVSILIAGIPWAFSVHGRITAIETHFKGMEIPPEWFREKVADNTRDIQELEQRVKDLERRQ